MRLSGIPTAGFLQVSFSRMVLILRPIIAVGIFLSILAFICAMGGRSDMDAAHESREGVMDLKVLYAHCGLPCACMVDPHWEGETITLLGHVDPDNIFNRTRFPQLPYEKFTLVDRLGRSIEVWPQGIDNDELFSKLIDRSTDLVLVKGRLAAIHMPVGDTCSQGVRVLIDDAARIEFVTD